jgi:ketosteroid isomerase-like protein
VLLVEVRMTATGASSGLAVEQTGWQVLRFRDGKVIRVDGYGSRAEALEAVGLSD